MRPKILTRFRTKPLRAGLSAFGVTLAIEFFAPNTWFSKSIGGLSGVITLPALLLWASTFWSGVRVRIGKLKLRYKVVRHNVGIAALMGFAFVVVRVVSLEPADKAGSSTTNSPVSTPESSDFYQQGPPADLITMLTRGDPAKQHCLGVGGLNTELFVAKQQLCKILVNNYYNIQSVKDFGYQGWSYGLKSSDELEESEAQLLLTEIGANLEHDDGRSLTRCEEIELAYNSARFLTANGSSDQDPVLNCLSFFPGLAHR